MIAKPFSLPYRKKLLSRLTGDDAESATRVAEDTGVSQQTLSRWLREARSMPEMRTKKKPGKTWAVDEKIRVLAEASKIVGPQLAALLEREGLVLPELEQWRLALGEDVKGSVIGRRRIRELERELARKDQALAEAAALLILKKKVEPLWADEDDDTAERSDK
jgi:transposase